MTIVHPREGWAVALLAGCAAYLYANLFAAPRTAFLLGGDQVFFWVDAQRLLYGEQIYRDFLEHIAPGTDLVYFGFFRLLGPYIWVPNLVVLLVGVGLCWLCWVVARSISGLGPAALAVGLFVVLVYGRMLNGTHHWFSVMAVLGALAIVLQARTPARIAMAGALLGLATFFTQTRGPVAAIALAVCLAFEHFQKAGSGSSVAKRLALLFVPLAATWLALAGYFLGTLGWRTFWFFQVTYSGRYALNGWSLDAFGWPHTLSLSALPDASRLVFACVVVPCVYLLALWSGLRDQLRAPSESSMRVLMVAAVGTGMFVETLPSPSWLRIYCVAAPAVILIPYLVLRLGFLATPALRLLSVGVVALAAALTWSRHTSQSVTAQLPGGRVATVALQAEKLGWLAAHTHPGQFVLQAGWLSIYLPLGLRNPLFLDYLESGSYDRLGYLTLSIRQMEARQVQYVLWSPRLDAPAYGLSLFRNYLDQHYRRVWRFSDADEIWERQL